MRDIRKVTSRDNEQLKSIRRVRDGKDRGKIFLEGVRLVDEAARSRLKIETVVASEEFVSDLPVDDLDDWLRPRTIIEVPESVLQSLADTTNSQGIIAIAERPTAGRGEIEERLQTSTIPVVVFLDRVNNPSNLGAVLRTAEAAGAAGVIVSSGSADVFSTKALRSAMGSSLRLAVWSDVEFSEAIEWARGIGLRSTAADINAQADYTEIDWHRPRMLVLGSEASGLSDEDRRLVDDLILVPMENKVESLNLAVASGVILFEAKRQHRANAAPQH